MSQLLIKEFPDDKRFWAIRMIDKISLPNSHKKTPSVIVWLTSVDFQSKQANSQFRLAAQENRFCQVHVGMMSAIDIGDIYCEKVLVGRLNSITKKGTFDIQRSQLLQANSTAINVQLPDWWTYPYRVINRSEFALMADYSDNRTTANFMNSYFTVLHAADYTLVIPTSVIFKTFYAPQSDFAIALTCGPWETNQRDIVMPERCQINDDGTWDVCLADRIPDNFLNWAALLSLTAKGETSAKKIHSELLVSDFGYLKAQIPFDGELEIRFEAIELFAHPKKLLCTRITFIKWPFDVNLIQLSRENDNAKGKKQVEVDRDKPYARRKAAELEEKAEDKGTIPNSSGEDPVTAYKDIRLLTGAFGWLNGPESIKKPKDVSGIYRDTKISHDVTSKDETSFGQNHQGESNTVEATSEVDTAKINRALFAMLTRLFDEMCKKNVIQGWSVVNSRDGYKQFRTGYSVWALPKTQKDLYGRDKSNAWVLLSKKKDVGRTMFVCLITTHSKNEYLWFEIESKKAKGETRALIYKLNEDVDMYDVIEHVCLVAAECKGVWKNGESDLIDVNSTWKHQYAKDGQFDIKSVRNRFKKLYNETMPVIKRGSNDH